MCDLLSLPLPWPVREQTIVWLVTRQSRTVLLVVPTLYEGRCADHLPLSPCSRSWLGDCPRPRTRHSLLQRGYTESKMAPRRVPRWSRDSRPGLSSIAYLLVRCPYDNNLIKRSSGYAEIIFKSWSNTPFIVLDVIRCRISEWNLRNSPRKYLLILD